ncbi:MAG: hypothetical protein PHV66_10215 [Bacteroidales bacterium]|nr:hypothetical protein [Bacteroidales bacterium]
MKEEITGQTSNERGLTLQLSGRTVVALLYLAGTVKEKGSDKGKRIRKKRQLTDNSHTMESSLYVCNK